MGADTTHSKGAALSHQRWRACWLPALALLTAQAAALWVVAERHGTVFNPDAVAYVRLADYWRAGRWNLAVSGYWGPAFCWLVAPCRELIADPATAGRAAMAISASLFTASCIAPMWILGLRGWRLLAAWGVAGVIAVEWSIHSISPDALLSAALNVSLAMLFAPAWLRPGRWPLLTGAWFGAAYLVKAIALPLAVFAVLAVVAVRWVNRDAGPKALAKAALTTGLGLALVAGPWVATLSLKYRRPTFSTTAAIAHAVVGPHGVFGEHPVVASLHQVEPGRITAWEDPSHLPYPYWTPWESSAAARHQLNLCAKNAAAIARWIARFDVLHLSLMALAVALVPWARISPNGDQRWRWMVVPAVTCAAMYLPVYAENSRYFYPLYAWLLGGTLSAATSIVPSHTPRRAWTNRMVFLAALASFAVVAVEKCNRAWRRPDLQTPYAAAQVLAGHLKTCPPQGPLAGGREVGMYAALLVGQPWLGHDPQATIGQFERSGAKVCLVSTLDEGQWAAFHGDPRFERTTGISDARRADSRPGIPPAELTVFHRLEGR